MQKNLNTLLVLLALTIGMAIYTKPKDEDCISAAARHTVGSFAGDMANYTGISNYAFRVADMVVYKDIYSTITDEHIARAYFGQVVFD